MAGQGYYKLRPSGYLTLLLFLLCVVSLVSIWTLPLPSAVWLVLALVVPCWLCYHWLLDANLRMGRSCVVFRLEGGEEIVLVLRNGRHISGRVSGDSLVTPYLVILNVLLSEQPGQRSLLIFPDAMGKESFRLLRVAMRWSEKDDQATL